MKQIPRTIAFFVIMIIMVSSCAAMGKKENNSEEQTASYAFGMAIGESLKDTGVKLDYDKFVEGLKDVIEKDKPTMTIQEAQQAIQNAMQKGYERISAENAKAESDFLEKNSKKSGIITTGSGLQYEVIKLGDGSKPTESDMVKVDYVGTFISGKQFDSSIDAGEPAVFPVNMVIPGWVEGLQLMPVGSKFKFYIPSSLAYGPQGSQGGIPPNSALIFEVELLSIEAGDFEY